MKYKIIYIHQRPYPYNQNFYELDSDYYFYFGHGALFDMHRDELFRNTYDFEICRGEVGVKKLKTKIVNGTKCLIFPAYHFYRIGTISFSLLKYLLTLAKKEKIIIHYTASPHTYEFYIITFLLGSKIPIFVTHQGGPNPYYKLQKKFRLGTFISYNIEKHISKYVFKYFSGAYYEIEYFKKITSSSKVYDKPTWGVDLENYKPIDKLEARKLLNLPENKKIILLFGKLNKYRGILNAIKVRDTLKKEFDVDILNVGSDETCPDYEIAKKNGVILRGIVPYERMKYYFSAGDVYLYLTEGEENFYYAGTGIAPLESLACNTPIVANTLHNFPFIDFTKAGVYAKTIDEAVEGIKYIFRNPERLSNTRSIIEQYFDWHVITRNLFNFYNDAIKIFY